MTTATSDGVQPNRKHWQRGEQKNQMKIGRRTSENECRGISDKTQWCVVVRWWSNRRSYLADNFSAVVFLALVFGLSSMLWRTEKKAFLCIGRSLDKWRFRVYWMHKQINENGNATSGLTFSLVQVISSRRSVVVYFVCASIQFISGSLRYHFRRDIIVCLINLWMFSLSFESRGNLWKVNFCVDNMFSNIKIQFSQI